MNLTNRNKSFNIIRIRRGRSSKATASPTKAQIVTHFVKKFELSKKTTAEILDEVAALAVSITKGAPGRSIKL